MPIENKDVFIRIAISSDHMNRALNEIDKAIMRIHSITTSSLIMKEIVMAPNVYRELKDSGLVQENDINLISEEDIKIRIKQIIERER
jgi:hypothetical protein